MAYKKKDVFDLPVVTFDSGDPATVEAPSDGNWAYSGTVTQGGSLVTAAALTSLAYQIDDGPPINLTPSPSWSFNLTETDLPAAGTYLLSVYAWVTVSGKPVGCMNQMNITRAS